MEDAAVPVLTDLVPLSTFEKLIVSGELSRLGAQKHRHEVQQAQPGPAPQTPLPPGSQVARAWTCRKNGLHRVLGLDRWVHHERLAKVTPDRLDVSDTLVWHDGASVAKRSYCAVARGPQAMQRHVGPWEIRMKGVNALVRSKVESEMHRELPKLDTILGDILQETHREQAKSRSEKRGPSGESQVAGENGAHRDQTPQSWH
jgi:hypothetical protein